MKQYIYILLFLVSLGVKAAEPLEGNSAEWLGEHYTHRTAMIPMRDGISLYAVILEPKDNTMKHPIIMERTPYNAEYYDLTGPAWKPYLDNGYILVMQDVRGKNHSEGEFLDLRPIEEKARVKGYNKRVKENGHILVDEASDTYDTAEWLTKNTSCNGSIGVMGISYPGFYATMAALSNHPAIKAVSPQAPVTDWFTGDDSHHNGAFFQEMMGFAWWFEYGNRTKPSEGRNPTNISAADDYDLYLNKIGTLKHATELMGDSVTMWNDNINHTTLDDWWKARQVTRHCSNVHPAVMIVGGLFDAEDCYGAWATYRAIHEQSPETELYLVEGPWSHGGWVREATKFFGPVYMGDEADTRHYIENVEYPFFAYYLEGKGEKPVAKRIFRTGENRWEQSTSNDLVEAECLDKSLYLHSNHQITDKSETNGTILAEYVSDPEHPVPHTALSSKGTPNTYMIEDQRFAATRTDVAVFSTPVLTDTLRMSGPIVADLTVSLDATDADFVVKVIDVFPDTFEYDKEVAAHSPQPWVMMNGYQMLVRAEIMRGKFRNSLSNPEPFVPGEPTKVKIQMNDVCHTFLPGHKVMVQVQSSWYPLVDRNPQTFCDIYSCDASTFRSCKVNILSPSRIWFR